MSELWDRMVTELAFLDVVREESRRAIHCEPHRVDQLRAAVDQLGAADLITVHANPACPSGKMLIFDEGAMTAEREEFLQGLTKAPWKFGETA